MFLAKLQRKQHVQFPQPYKTNKKHIKTKKTLIGKKNLNKKKKKKNTSKTVSAEMPGFPTLFFFGPPGSKPLVASRRKAFCVVFFVTKQPKSMAPLGVSWWIFSFFVSVWRPAGLGLQKEASNYRVWSCLVSFFLFLCQ